MSTQATPSRRAARVEGERAAGRPRFALADVLASLRPRQWVKNLFIFAGLVFSQKLLTPATLTAVAAFAVFCGLSGAIYLLNDVADRERDRLHPEKRNRPIAAGRLGVTTALVIAGVLLIGGLGVAAWLSWWFFMSALTYVTLLAAYSAWLKHMVIVDVLTVAIGFVLRAVAGAVVIEAEISGWLLICTILIALLLVLGKRRHEYLALEREAARHRPILGEYSVGLLDQMIAVVTASTITAYALYTMSPQAARFHAPLLPTTVPFVLYGIFRYLYLLYRQQLGGNPSELFLRDRPLFVNTLGWVVAVLVIIYGTG